MCVNLLFSKGRPTGEFMRYDFYNLKEKISNFLEISSKPTIFARFGMPEYRISAWNHAETGKNCQFWTEILYSGMPKLAKIVGFDEITRKFLISFFESP